MVAKIPFSRPYLTGREGAALARLLENGQLCGDGVHTQACEAWLEQRLGCAKAYLTHSCTAALEMAAMLLDLGPGDEVILPSFTFSSTANAIVLRGATPVFADCDPTTMNLDLNQTEALITPRTKAIFVVHYAGLPPDMDAVMLLARTYGIYVVEDAAQSLGSTYDGAPAGTHGHLAAFSFHETKNVISGEGGALIVNDARFADRAAILREKGTNRRAFKEGQVDKYSWMDMGSSYVPSELIAAVLRETLLDVDAITARRLDIWDRYTGALARFAARGLILPRRQEGKASHNGHIFYVLLPQAAQRAQLLQTAAESGVQLTFHYVPLHSAPAGERFGIAPLGCQTTTETAARLVRLPMSAALTDAEVDRVITVVTDTLEALL